MKFFLQIGILLSTSFILAQSNPIYINNRHGNFNYANGFAKSVDLQSPVLYHGSGNSYYFQNDSLEIPHNYRKSEIFSFSLYLDWIFSDFSEFGNEIGRYNADFLSTQPVFAGLELSYYGNKGGFFGLRFSGLLWMINPSGSLGYSVHYNDTLELENRLTQLGMHVGYTILKTKYVNITPKVAFNWNRHRLLNYQRGNVSLAQYANNREMDIRFNQFMGTIGATINMNFMKKNDLKDSYWSIGFTGAYCFKFHNRPLIYSIGNVLESNSKIYYQPFCFSIYISFNGIID